MCAGTHIELRSGGMEHICNLSTYMGRWEDQKFKAALSYIVSETSLGYRNYPNKTEKL